MTMTALTSIRHGQTTPTPRAKRSIADLLAPLNQLAQTSPHVVAKPGAFHLDETTCELPRYVFIGRKAGDEPLRVGLFAAIHGDEPEGAFALARYLTMLDGNPELAAGYCLFVYPVCNPTGFEDNTRCSRRNHDLNREFWNNSNAEAA